MAFQHIIFLTAFVVLFSELYFVYQLQKRMLRKKPGKKNHQYHTTLEQVVRFEKELQHYLNRSKSNREIGLLYERYVGYRLEMDGYSVEYYGAIKGDRDLGIDLIAKNGEETLIIQTKYWAKTKVIKEKPIEQLAEIAQFYRVTHKKENKVKAVFFATTDLTQEADDKAILNEVKFIKMDFDRNYPMIKCNINQHGEKIFHLPTDEYYDKVKIDFNSGECYTKTVAEAVAKGFRRAFKHKAKRSA